MPFPGCLSHFRTYYIAPTKSTGLLACCTSTGIYFVFPVVISAHTSALLVRVEHPTVSFDSRTRTIPKPVAAF